VARDVTRAKKVAVLDDIAGTYLDKGDEIDTLGKLPEGQQRKLATAARAGEKVESASLLARYYRGCSRTQCELVLGRCREHRIRGVPNRGAKSYTYRRSPRGAFSERQAPRRR